MFELKIKDKTIPLNWGTWSMHEFTKEKNLTIQEFFQVLSNSQIDLGNIVSFIFIGYKHAALVNKVELEYTEFDVYEWLDEMGGMLDVNGQVMGYMKYIISSTTAVVSKKETTVEKKKGK
jgi:hypothetical protein